MSDVSPSIADRAFMEKLEILAGKLWITEGEKYGLPDVRFDIRQPVWLRSLDLHQSLFSVQSYRKRVVCGVSVRAAEAGSSGGGKRTGLNHINVFGHNHRGRRGQ